MPTFSFRTSITRIIPMLALLGVSVTCDEQPCPIIDCAPLFSLSLNLPAGDALALPLSARLCLDDTCDAVGLGAPSEIPSRHVLQFPAQMSAGDAIVWMAGVTLTTRSADATSLDLSWFFSSPRHNGDRYRVSVTDANGASLGAFDKGASYQESQPFGAACGGCPSATLE